MRTTLLAALVIVVTTAVALLLVTARIARTQSQTLPKFTKDDVSREDHVAAFVDAFLERDVLARPLLNRSNRELFVQGYRPTVGVPLNPERAEQRFFDIRAYFVRKLYLDLGSIQPLERLKFQSFIDEIGQGSDQTLICAGQIARKYRLNFQGSFIWQEELAKVPQGQERELFKRC